jgi:hypothetical protein
MSRSTPFTTKAVSRLVNFVARKSVLIYVVRCTVQLVESGRRRHKPPCPD